MPGVTHGICQCQILFSFHNGAANTTAIPGGSEGELEKFDVDWRSREEVPVVSFVRGSRKYRRFRAAGKQFEPTMLPPRRRQKLV